MGHDYSQQNRSRVLLGKIGFDGHDRGIKIIASILRNAGYEVIYLGKYLRTESLIRAAIEEDVDVIGLSFLGGSHVVHCREVEKMMRENSLKDVLFVIGGVIPQKDLTELKKIGVDGIFPANTMSQEVLQFLEKNLKKKTQEKRQ